MMKNKYERIEITFNTTNEDEMAIYKYILEKSQGLGKAKWLKNLIRKDMNKAKE
jgi:hypothetical protein